MAASSRTASPVFDRMPPQNIDAERSVLGAMLLNPEAVGAAIEILRDSGRDVFYADAHALIYDAMVGLYRNNTPIDAVTLVEQLTRADALERVGGVVYVSELLGVVPTSANVAYYAQIVLDAAILRRLIATCTHLANEAYALPENTSDLLDQAESQIFAIAETRQLNPIMKVSDLLEDSIKRIEEIMKSRSGITGLSTGFAGLDEMLSGLQPSDMVVLAARPSVGKTAFALNIARHVAIHEEKSVLVFSLEMSKEQLTQRLLCMEGQIDSGRLRTGFLARAEFPKLQKAADRLSRAGIYIDDTPNITLLDLRAKARRQTQNSPVHLIIIDYLQLMSGVGRSENRQVEIAEISRAVKGLARELRAPVLALSQLSREAEKDDSGVPKLAHLRESGAIEQDADVVLMLSRPPASEAEGNENLIRVSVAKQRNGPTGKVDMLFDKPIQRFKALVRDAGGARPAPVEEGPPAGFDGEPPVPFNDDEDIPF